MNTNFIDNADASDISSKGKLNLGSYCVISVAFSNKICIFYNGVRI